MSSRLRRMFGWGLCLVGCLGLLLPVGAQTPPAPKMQSVFRGDGRLEKPVTVRWKKKTLYDALQDLTKLTGARLAVEIPLIDEPVMSVAVNMPASELLDRLAEMLHLTWVRSGGTPEKPGYLLYQTRAAKDEEEALIQQDRLRVRRALLEQVQRYRELARLGGDELAREQAKTDGELERAFSGGLQGLEQNPKMVRNFQDSMALSSISSPIGRTLLDLVNQLGPSQWQYLENGFPLVFSSRPLEGEAKLPSAAEDVMRSNTPRLPLPASLFKALGPQMEGLIKQTEATMAAPWQGGTGYRVTVNLSLNTGAQPVGMFRVSPEPLTVDGENALAPLFAQTGLMMFAAPTLLEEPTEDPMEREKRLSADPLLGKRAEVKLPPPADEGNALLNMRIPGVDTSQGRPAAEVLGPIQEAFGVQILSDAYTRQAIQLYVPPGTGPQPLFKVLDKLAGGGRTWEATGNLIRLRSKSWAYDRRSEIPARYMRKWLADRERLGGFTLDLVSEIASTLRDEQVESLMFAAWEFGGLATTTDMTMLTANKNLLRLWGKLIPPQRQALLAGRPIAVAELFPYQREMVAGLNRGQGSSMMGMAFGAKPVRTPKQLNGAVLALQAQAANAGPAPAEPAPDPKDGMAQILEGARLSTTFNFELRLADGQKDRFMVMLTRVVKPKTPVRPTTPPPGRA